MTTANSASPDLTSWMMTRLNLGVEDRQLVAARSVHILGSNRPVPPPALEGFANPVDGYERTPDRRRRTCRATAPIESEIVRDLHRVLIPASGLLDVMQRANPFEFKTRCCIRKP